MLVVTRVWFGMCDRETATFHRNGTTLTEEHIINGCYRPPTFPWYLQPFPWWTQFIIVPIFSILSSLANLQPFWTVELVVMVVISCVSYAANKVANHFIFNRSDVVSAIGAFAVGLLGNIYSRKMGGTAFTSMVTGVLFLVPVSVTAVAVSQSPWRRSVPSHAPPLSSFPSPRPPATRNVYGR